MIFLAIVVAFLASSAPNYSRIEDGLYVGGSVEQPPPGTKAVLNLCETEDVYNARSYAWFPIPDAAPAPSLGWLWNCVKFIDDQRMARRQVYVHCAAGVSRSGMVAAAYLMWRDNLTRDEALARLRVARPQIQPNAAFMQRLLEWERVIRNR